MITFVGANRKFIEPAMAEPLRPLSVRAQNSTSRASGQSFSERLVGVGGCTLFAPIMGD
jgi:hypothetical protein